MVDMDVVSVKGHRRSAAAASKISKPPRKMQGPAFKKNFYKNFWAGERKGEVKMSSRSDVVRDLARLYVFSVKTGRWYKRKREEIGQKVGRWRKERVGLTEAEQVMAEMVAAEAQEAARIEAARRSESRTSPLTPANYGFWLEKMQNEMDATHFEWPHPHNSSNP